MSQPHHDLSRRQNQAQQQTFGCQTYHSPTPNQVVEAFSTATLEWDPHCFDSAKNIDIYLQSLDVAQPIHVWKNVVASSAKLSTQFIPDWWNSTQSVSLQIVITPSDLPLWAGLGPGPIFFAHFNGSIPAGAPTSAHEGKQLGGPSIEYITDLFHRSHHALSGGKLGAAIFLPLLAVAIAISSYIFISRRRSGQASKRWSEYVDKRMSVMGSQTWDSPMAGSDPLPSVRGIPGSRVASMYRHSASLPQRDSMIHAPNARLSTFSLNRPVSVRPPTLPGHHSRNTSLAGSAARVSFVDRQSGISFPRPGSEFHPNPNEPPVAPFRPAHQATSSMSRSVSNLRFELDAKPTTDSPSSNKSKPLKVDTEVLSDRASSAGSSDKQSASGMRRLDGASTLSPDEALRQYTLFRGRDEERASTPSNAARADRGSPK
ncbi:hypothetical protein PGT21_020846 [Puccinia graminis f. sp. tritici]|uniref:Uncharacterized protein n=2 Tax=Puccinia graminis f. sp. tritici TaxID=56615 RepID=A0A5B0PPB9_PUCGR|nr:hypothetical protein PGT21_020846 [Puccinia graminis f. sp. tritici]